MSLDIIGIYTRSIDGCLGDELAVVRSARVLSYSSSSIHTQSPLMNRPSSMDILSLVCQKCQAICGT